MSIMNEDSCDDLWNESVCNKSWADLVEESECLNNLKNRAVRKSPIKNNEIKKSTTKDPLLDENTCDIPIAEGKGILIPKSEVLPNFSVSYVKVETEVKTPKKKNLEPVEEFLQEDLSLTTHLTGFQLVSPCKVDQKTPTKSTIGLNCRNDQTENKSDNKNTKRKLNSVEDTRSDELLQPSPSKIRRHNTPSINRTQTPKKTPIEKYSRKRSREITPGKSSEKKNPPRELETDPEVLSRRQKQIDYGKNTIGYERYCQLVPKDSRGKMYPRTPPMHLKFSRRAWDGLIKVWRQRLHFWDPPSEGGGNPECLEISSDLSDVSSTDGSLPNTPVQDKKRLRSKRSSTGLCVRKERFEAVSGYPFNENDEDNDDEGCTPLPST